MHCDRPYRPRHTVGSFCNGCCGYMKIRLISTIKNPTFSMACLFLTAALLFNGCGWFKEATIERPVYELVQEGADAYARGDYRDSIKNFEQLKDWYPFSKFAILAELKIADSHYHLQEYPEAIQAYEEFERLHPRNEAIPYIIYQIGLCYYEQIDTVDRDQTTAQKALETFDRLMQQYPQTSYSLQAQSHRIRCLQSLSGHDFYVGMFYLKNGNYKAALHRFKTVVTRYPDVGMHHKALRLITKCENLIAQKNGAKTKS